MTSQTDRRNGITGNLGIKAPCRCATTANITLSGLQTIDGITVVANDRVLVKDQTDTTQNGVYNASSSTWQRALDFDGVNDVVSGTLVVINSGTTNANTVWKLNATNPISFDTTELTFTYALNVNDYDNLLDLANLASVANLSTLANLVSVDNLLTAAVGKGADIASASTVNLTTATGEYVNITGTTTITAITLASGTQRLVCFNGILTLTHGASLVLPSAANITTAAGDFALFVGDASSVVRCAGYFRADGTPIVAGNQATESVAGIAEIATQAETNAGSDDTRIVTPLKLRFGFAASLAASGYIAFPSWLGGWIVQWGTVTGSWAHTSSQSANFPIAFPTASYRVIIGSPTTNDAGTCGITASTTTNFTFKVINYTGTTQTYTIQFLAVGK